MKPMRKSATLSLFPFVALLIAALSLSGCGGMSSFPDTVVPGSAQQTPIGAIQGSVLGGHAPIVGAHVYVLSPNTTSYGGVATSLITTGTGVSTNTNGDPGIQSGWKYVTTDSTGSFNITGDYTCTAGNPVYLYATGGTPETGSQTASISSVTVTGSGPYTYTFNTTAPEYAYTGEAFKFSQNFGSFVAGFPFNVATTPSTTSFTMTSGNYNNPSSLPTGLTVTFTPAANPGIVNLAVLGVCPNSGSLVSGGPLYNGTTSSPVTAVFMNEVSTVAAAYAFAPFSANGYSPTSGTNYATYIGTSSTNLVGIENAALTAGMLYSINGSGPLSTTSVGEGRIANATTPTGNGTINQVTIDTVANILASCVDSNSTSTTVGNSNISTQCGTLFQYATNTGVPTSDPSPGLQPYDTATAAINIALHPNGPPGTDTSTTPASWVAALYNLPTATVPFTPNLTTQPNDFTVGILYTGTNTNNPQLANAAAVAVDKIGEIWFTTQTGSSSGYSVMMSPQGVLSNASSYSFLPGPPVIDSQGDVWTQEENQQGPTYYLKATTSSNPYVYAAATAAVAPPAGNFLANTVTYAGDSSGNMYFINPTSNNSSTGYWYLSKWSLPLGSNGVGVGRVDNSLSDTTYNATGGAIDASGGIWLTEYNSSTPTNYIMRTLLASGASPSTTLWPVTQAKSGCANLSQPTGVAITRSGDAIVASEQSNSVMYIGQTTAACTELTNTTTNVNTGMSNPVSVAVDGQDYVYVLNHNSTTATAVDGSITVLNTRSGNASGTYGETFRFSPQYQPGSTLTSMLYYPVNMALDPSGNIWVVNEVSSFGRGSSVVEIVGAALPTSTPLSSAVCTSVVGCIGYRP